MRFAVADEVRLSTLTYQQVTEAIDGLLAGLPPGEHPEDAPVPADTVRLLQVVGIEQAADVPDDEAIHRRRNGLYQLAAEEGWEEAAQGAVIAGDD